jgi:hypothetical protein
LIELPKTTLEERVKIVEAAIGKVVIPTISSGD